MKKKAENTLCVAGWTDYDDEYYPECEITDEVFDAIVREVREHKYLFGGDSHQDWSDCCPVLSNGCRACFSWRGWGAVIAAAYGHKGKCSYMVGYMDELIVPEAIRRPPSGVDERKFAPMEKTKHIFDAPPSKNAEFAFGWCRCWMMPETDATRKVQAGDYIYPRIVFEDGDSYVDQGFKVLRFYRGATFEETYAAFRERDSHVAPEWFGYGDFSDPIDEDRFFATLHADYPGEHPDGIVCFDVRCER